MANLDDLTTITTLSNYLVEENIDPSEQNSNENRSVAKINEVVLALNDGSVVETGGAQTITGVKTFSGGIKVNQIDPLTANAKITVEVGTGGLYANDDSSAVNKYQTLADVNTAIAGVSGATVMVGATSGVDGVAGLVTKPVAGEQTYGLLGSGVWTNLSARTETLTNKTIDGDNNTLQDISGASIKSTSKFGNTNVLATVTGSISALNLPGIDANNNLYDSTISVIQAKHFGGIAAAKSVTNTTFSAVPEFAVSNSFLANGRTYEWTINAAFDINTTCGLKVLPVLADCTNISYFSLLTVVEGSSGAATLNGGRDPSSNPLTHVPAGAGTFGYRSTGSFTAGASAAFSFQFANNASGGVDLVALRAGATLTIRCVG